MPAAPQATKNATAKNNTSVTLRHQPAFGGQITESGLFNQKNHHSIQPVALQPSWHFLHYRREK